MSETHPDDALAVAAAANRAQTARMAKPDKSYVFVWRNYLKWLASCPAMETNEPPFLTRRNVDHYFTIIVAKKRVVRNTVTRYVSTLQWYADNLPTEHAAGGKGSFVVRSPAVEEAVRAQQAHYKEAGAGKPGADPHKGLKDAIPLPQRLRILRFIYRERGDWGPTSVFFNWGLNVGLRGHSNRSMNLCDLNMSRAYGAEEDGPVSRSLLLILRKGDVHKDRKDMDGQVGCWRHKHYELCSVLSTAAHVVWTLSNNDQVDFFHPDLNKRAKWWDLPLIDWKEYNGTLYISTTYDVA
jgi:hypothetical protein